MMAAFQRILMATDLSPASDAAFEEAVRLAREAKARLDVVHVYQIPASASLDYVPASAYFDFAAAARIEADRKLQELLSRESARGLEVRPILQKGFADERIVETAKREQSDVIVMGTHGRRGAARLFLGSVAARVIAAASCPVLTIRCAAPGVERPRSSAPYAGDSPATPALPRSEPSAKAS
jgi:nucleotide-binding universal stress UspA family protein